MKHDHSAYEKAALDGGDPRCTPIALDRPAPVDDGIAYPAYPAEDHETWRILFARQRELLEERACDEFLAGLERMAFGPSRIPALRDAARVLREATGWSIARVPGLLHERDFFTHLARRVFPATDYVRPRHELDYTPAPDLFHDVFGHTPMITNPVFAEFYQRMGQAALESRGEDRRRMERFYWFTVEFGLIRTPRGLRVYGNGILSSYAEVQHALSDSVEKVAFDPERLTNQDYDVWHLQKSLYVIESFEQLAEGFDRWSRRCASI